MKENQQLSVPIREWTLRNFKSVEDASVQFAPLTVLVGGNSSGKSSLLQSILLISQAAGSEGEQILQLNGPLVELGDFAEVLFAGTRQELSSKAARQTIGISGVFDFSGGRPPIGRAALWQTPAIRIGTIHWGGEFCAVPRGAQLGAAQVSRSELRVVNDDGNVVFSFETKGLKRKTPTTLPWAEIAVPIVPLKGRLKESDRPIRVSGLTQVGGIPTQFFIEKNLLAWLVGESIERSSVFLGSGHTSGERPPDARARGIDLDLLVETLGRQVVSDFARYAHVDSPALEKLGQEGRGSRRDLIGRDLLAEERIGLFKSVFEWSQRVIAHEAPQLEERRTLVPLEIRRRMRGRVERVGSALVQFMARNILYLGPLREDPHVVYASAPGDRPGNVGKKGERTIAILHQFGSQRIECPRSDGSTIGCTLAEGVSYWLHEFGIADNLDTELRPRLGLEPHLKIADVGRKLDLTSVGVGVSQVLPVLVMGLHAPRGTVLLMEQPELHLHPALQHRLGDFLLACSMNGKQLVVETHSDHLVTRLRRRIAESDRDELLRSVKLIFVERTNGRTAYNPVEVTPFGTLPHWPAGFFDQSASESKEIVRAGVEKRKRTSEETGEE